MSASNSENEISMGNLLMMNQSLRYFSQVFNEYSQLTKIHSLSGRRAVHVGERGASK